jgi:LPXTG-motif cell wall-anchored protein
VTGTASFAVTNQTVNLTVTLAPVPASSFPVVFLVAGGVAATLAVLLVGFFVFRRRKKDRA